MLISRQERCADGFCCRTACFSAFEIEFLLLSARMQSPPDIQPKTNNLAMQQGPSWNPLAFRCHPPGDQEFLTTEWSYCESQPTSADSGIPVTPWRPSEPQLLPTEVWPNRTVVVFSTLQTMSRGLSTSVPSDRGRRNRGLLIPKWEIRERKSSPGPELGNQGPKIPRLVQIKSTYKTRSLFP